MPVERPTLTALVTRIVGDIDTRLPDLFAAIPQNPANVFATAVAGISHGVYGYIDEQFVQVLPTTATGLNLEKWGEFTKTVRLEPTAAVVPVQMVVNSIPTTIPSLTPFRRSDGVLYQTTEELLADTTPYDFEVTALLAGENGTVLEDTILTMAVFIEGLSQSAVATATGEGEDLEDEEAWRGRIIDKFRDHAQGGADADYIKWAKEVPGVGHAWVIPSIPPYVDLRIASNDEDDLEASTELINAVQAYILDEPDRRKKPVNAVLATATAAVTPQNFEFSVFDPDTSSTRAAVETALLELLGTAEIRQPGSLLKRNAVIAAIQNTNVVASFLLASPATDVQYGTVQFPTMGDVIYP